MYINIAESSIGLNSDIIETNILNLIVVLIALGVLVRQYFSSVIESYEIPLYEALADSYALEKDLQTIQDDYTETLAIIIRIYLNALLSSKYSSLEIKALAFIRTECLRQRILQFERKTIKALSQEMFESWYLAIFDEVKEQFIKELKEDPQKHQDYIEAKLAQFENLAPDESKV